MGVFFSKKMKILVIYTCKNAGEIGPASQPLQPNTPVIYVPSFGRYEWFIPFIRHLEQFEV
jgi:hypothetical protein